MTLVEMTITVGAVGFLLFLVLGWMATLQEQTKEDLARRMLADLDKALVRYRRATGSYPTLRGPNSTIPPVVDLLDQEKTRPILEVLPSCLRGGPGRVRLLDPWGTPLRYLPADSDNPRVKANGGRPIFESAGPDRDFGDTNPVALGNNLRSDDPGPNGFRIHQVFRDALAEQEEGVGQKGNQ